MLRVLVVEDEPTIATGLQDGLAMEGYSVDVVADGDAALARARAGDYDLVLLDLMLPKKDGLTVCRELRASGIRVPVIMLTARTAEVDKIVGLEVGADDYVTKPFSLGELVARMRAVLRRSQAPEPETYEGSGLHVDFSRYEAWRAGKPIDLTATEFRLLRAFVAHRGKALAIDQLLDEVWGKDVFLTERVIYTHVNNLRSKIEPDPSKPRLLVSVRGIGYRFDG